MILAVDGAEFTIIRDDKELNNLRQIEFGTHSVPHLSTSVLWPAFLTGLEPEDFPYTYQRWKVKFIDEHRLTLGKFLDKIKLRGVVSSVLRKFGLIRFKDPFNPDFSEWTSSIPTIFSLAKHPVAISIPMYTKGKRMSIQVPLENMEKQRMEEIEAAIMEEFWNITANVWRRIDEDWDLFMVHWGLLDFYQHFKYADPKAVLGKYRIVDEVIGELKATVPKDCITLVVSDHGSIEGLHPPYGFYSLNRKLDLKKKLPDLSITDYHDVVKALLSEEPIKEKPSDLTPRNEITSNELESDWKLRKSLEILKRTYTKYERVAASFSTRNEDMIVTHMLLQMGKKVPVVFVDTTQHFKETYGFMENMVKRWGLELYTAKSSTSYSAVKDDKQICCLELKIKPELEVLEKHRIDAYIDGARWYEGKGTGPHRERQNYLEHYFSPQEISLDWSYIRVHPLLHWSQEDVASYMKRHNIPMNPLYSKEYVDVNCKDCAVKAKTTQEEASKDEIVKRLRAMGYF